MVVHLLENSLQGLPALTDQRGLDLSSRLVIQGLPLSLPKYHKCNNRLEQYLLLLEAHSHQRRLTKYQVHLRHLHYNLWYRNLCSSLVKILEVLEECSE